MTETLWVPAWVRMERVHQPAQLLHPEYSSLEGAARDGWIVKAIHPLGGGAFGEKAYAVLVHLERDETSIADAKARADEARFAEE